MTDTSSQHILHTNDPYPSANSVVSNTSSTYKSTPVHTTPTPQQQQQQQQSSPPYEAGRQQYSHPYPMVCNQCFFFKKKICVSD